MIESTECAVETPAEAAAWIAASLPQSASTVAFIGCGLGYALEVVESRQPSFKAVVFEPDPAAASAMLARRDWSAWLSTGRLAVVTGPDYTGLAQIARSFPDLHTAATLVHPHLARTNPAAIDRACKALADAVFQTSANADARRASAGRYLLHTLANAPRIARESDAAALAGLSTGLPAIIAAAGPSLDANVHDVWPVRDRALIIACDTAARPLLAANIEPHLIVSADPSRVNAGHLSSIQANHSWLVAEGSLHPSAFTHFDRRTFFFAVANHHPRPWLTTLGLERAMLATWGSVATSAFSLALSMGCDPIIFVGADFAFTGNRPYCRGTSFEPQWASWVAGAAGGGNYPDIWQALVDRWPAVHETDIHGLPTRTARHLVSFRDWMVERAATSGRRIVNATGAGLFAGAGIEHARAGEVLLHAPPIGSGLIESVFRGAHRSRQGDLSTLFEGIDSIVRTPDGPDRDAWNAFTDSRVSAAAIDAALNSAEYVAWGTAMARQRSRQESR